MYKKIISCLCAAAMLCVAVPAMAKTHRVPASANVAAGKRVIVKHIGKHPILKVKSGNRRSERKNGGKHNSTAGVIYGRKLKKHAVSTTVKRHSSKGRKKTATKNAFISNVSQNPVPVQPKPGKARSHKLGKARKHASTAKGNKHKKTHSRKKATARARGKKVIAKRQQQTPNAQAAEQGQPADLNQQDLSQDDPADTGSGLNLNSDPGNTYPDSIDPGSEPNPGSTDQTTASDSNSTPDDEISTLLDSLGFSEAQSGQSAQTASANNQLSNGAMRLRLQSGALLFGLLARGW